MLAATLCHGLARWIWRMCLQLFNPRVGLCVWSQMNCCEWLKLSLKFNLAVRHAEPRYTKLWGHNDLIYARYYHWSFVNKFNCSKLGVIMVSGSQATLCTCNDYSGSNVLKIGATRYSIVTDCNYVSSCLLHYWTSSIATCMSYFDGAIKRKRRSWQNYTALAVTCIYGCIHHDHHT